jgi:hypothetical protein
MTSQDQGAEAARVRFALGKLLWLWAQRQQSRPYIMPHCTGSYKPVPKSNRCVPTSLVYAGAPTDAAKQDIKMCHTRQNSPEAGKKPSPQIVVSHPSFVSTRVWSQKNQSDALAEGEEGGKFEYGSALPETRVNKPH